MIYKFLNIPNHKSVSDQVYEYVLFKTRIMKANAIWNWANTQEILTTVPELKVALDQLNLEVQQISIVKAEPGSNIKMHIDYDQEPRALWPIKNTLGSYTKFFDVDTKNIVEQRGPMGDIYYEILNTDQATQIDSLELLAPVMFKPWIAHGIWSNPECAEPRLTMTIKFKNVANYVFSED